MTEGYTKVKSENENLYIANKKMWVQIKDTRIGRFFGTQRREREASQRKSNHSQRQEKEAQEKAVYWENEHSTTFEELTKCRKGWGQWKRKTEAKEIQYQKVLEEKIAL